jgi:hypothetical protein
LAFVQAFFESSLLLPQSARQKTVNKIIKGGTYKQKVAVSPLFNRLCRAVQFMKAADSDPSDQQLLLDLEGELSAYRQKRIRAHLKACWKCRARRQDLENAITDYLRVYQREFDRELPPVAGPRELLKDRLTQLSRQPVRSSIWIPVQHRLVTAAAICGLLLLSVVFARLIVGRKNNSMRAGIVFIPDSRLTPGATLLLNQSAVCAQPNIKNKAVPASMQRKVFEEYGIAGADPGMYEVDYLITPALGGADDIHNLWPHSYSTTLWNSRVKDALEDRLREMVCNGSLDLAEAQRAVAENWIAAYKKYFHTDMPLAEPCGTCLW